MINRGKLYLCISAFIYGLAPILAKSAYEGGVNGITLTFLRASLAVPILILILKSDHISLKLNKKELKEIILLGTVGGALPVLLLYISYNHISAGLATTLHFVYPILIIFASSVIYHERISRVTIIASIVVTIGIFLFADINSASDKVGIILAILSGVFYSFYVVFIDKSGLDRMQYSKFTFYLMLIISITVFLFGIITDSVSFSISGKSWAYAILISILITIFATPLFQVGVRYEGAASAGIISTIEPITTIILGAAFLGEAMQPMQYIGGALVVVGVIIANYSISEHKDIN